MEEKLFLVITKEVRAHKVYAASKEEAIRAYENGKEIDDYELDCVVDDVEEYED